MSALSRSPLISIVTASRNAVDGLAHTLASLRAQTFRDFEWIVADGASTDGTVAWLEEMGEEIVWWSSTPDAGIYDAWNKACAHVQGQWVLFLGAGDALAAPDVLARMAPILERIGPDQPLVYGRVQILSVNTRRPLDVLGEPWALLVGRWEIGRPALPPHGATFHHVSLLAGQQPFDSRYRIAADSKLLLSAIRHVAPFFVPVTVTQAPMGGVSFRFDSAQRMAVELRTINRELGIRPPFGHRLGEYLRLLIIVLVSWLPERFGYLVADAFRRMAGKPPRWTVR